MAPTTAVLRRAMPNSDGDKLPSAFLTAMLLTGSVPIAEAAVLRAIENNGNDLVRRSVEASLRTPGPLRLMSSEELETARNSVPLSLRKVLLLRRLPRQCFVLRVLLSLPCGECALLLNISEAEVGRYSGSAAATVAF